MLDILGYTLDCCLALNCKLWWILTADDLRLKIICSDFVCWVMLFYFLTGLSSYIPGRCYVILRNNWRLVLIEMLSVLMYVKILRILLNFIFFNLFLSILLNAESHSLLLMLLIHFFLSSIRLLRLSILKLLMNLRLYILSWRNFYVALRTNTRQKNQCKEISKHLFLLVIVLYKLVHNIWLLIMVISKLTISGGLIVSFDHYWSMLLVLIIN